MRIEIHPWNLLIVRIDGRPFTVGQKGINDWYSIKYSVGWRRWP